MAVITVMAKFPGATKKHEAIRYKESTVYTDAREGKPFGWRVKPHPGSRRTKRITVGSGTEKGKGVGGKGGERVHRVNYFPKCRANQVMLSGVLHL